MSSLRVPLSRLPASVVTVRGVARHENCREKEERMKQEQMYLAALLVIGLLASIPQVPVEAQIWGAILAIVGIVAGVMLNYENAVDRILIYVLAIAIPAFSNCLDAVWVVGPWLNTLLDNMATGIQGTAVGLFAIAFITRLKGAGSAGS